MSEKKKKKGGNSSSGGNSKPIEVDQFTGFKETIEKFLSYRDKSIRAAENVITLINKRTYMMKDQTNSITSSLGSSSVFAIDVEEEYLQTLDYLRKARFDTLIQLKRVSSVFNELSTSEISLPVENQVIEEIIQQLNQQSLVDEKVCDILLAYQPAKYNQDELITMASCLKLNPYLKESEIKAFLDLK